jgi:hypothetical protein
MTLDQVIDKHFHELPFDTQLAEKHQRRIAQVCARAGESIFHSIMTAYPQCRMHPSASWGATGHTSFKEADNITPL